MLSPKHLFAGMVTAALLVLPAYAFDFGRPASSDEIQDRQAIVAQRAFERGGEDGVWALRSLASVERCLDAVGMDEDCVGDPAPFPHEPRARLQRDRRRGF